MAWVLQDVVYNLSLLDLVKCSGVMSYTVVWLELFSTLEDEASTPQIRFIWPSRWSLMKTVFIINRYSPMVDTTLNVSLILYTTNPKSCEIQFDVLAGKLFRSSKIASRSDHFPAADTGSYITGSLASEVIIMARTLALYDFSFFVSFLMGAAGLGIIIPSIIVCHSFLATLVYPDTAVLRVVGGCVPTVEDRPVWVLYMCLIISETVVVLLTFYKMWQSPADRTHRSLLVRTMYRDGSLYYIVLLTFSIVNLCFMLLAPKAASSVVQMPFRVIHSTLCSRVLLNLRKVAAKLTEMSYDDFRHSRIAFEPDTRDGQRTSCMMDLELDTLEDDHWRR